MRYLATILLVCGFFSSVNAQTVNQDVDGNSSIVWPGGNFSFDTSEELIQVNYFTPFNSARGMIYGIDVQGKNNSGITELFGDGELVPEAQASFIIGRHFSERNLGVYEDSLAKYEYEKTKYEILRNISFDAFESTFRRDYRNLKSNFTAGTTEEEAIKIFLDNLKDNLDIKSVSEIISALESVQNEDKMPVGIKTHIDAFVNKLKSDQDLMNLKGYKEKLEEIAKRKSSLSNKKDVYSTKELSYWRGGFNVQEFRYDKGIDFTSKDTRFVDEKFAAPFIEYGRSYRQGDRFWGWNVGVDWLNNFSTLEKNTYTITANDSTIVGGDLESENSFEAYSGNYETYVRIRVNTDYMFTQLLKQDKYLYVGPYGRLNVSTDTDVQKHGLVLGAGAFLVNGKDGAFLGGVYFQSTQNLNEFDEIDFNDTFSIGLVAKFAFASAKPSL